MRQNLILLILIAMLALAGCGGAQSTAPAESFAPIGDGLDGGAAPPMALEEAAEREVGDAASGEPQSAQVPGQRLVIKNAYISVQVEDVSGAEASLRALADQLGGYVVSVETRGSDADQISTITFRVPSEQFENALADVEGLARKVFSRSVSGEDVTEEFVDLESRLRNLEATRDRLLDLLERATRVEDALEVNNALSDVQGQIEQIQGRMQYLQESAAMSTITAELQGCCKVQGFALETEKMARFLAA
jgi:hypothetical protein